jgi:hypothetical protein
MSCRRRAASCAGICGRSTVRPKSRGVYRRQPASELGFRRSCRRWLRETIEVALISRHQRADRHQRDRKIDVALPLQTHSHAGCHERAILAAIRDMSFLGAAFHVGWHRHAGIRRTAHRRGHVHRHRARRPRHRGKHKPGDCDERKEAAYESQVAHGAHYSTLRRAEKSAPPTTRSPEFPRRQANVRSWATTPALQIQARQNGVSTNICRRSSSPR